jgi:LmbE family N-acetylglucosaminyl deacetylase
VSGNPDLRNIRRVAVVVAHPDDETLWAGGLLLGHTGWNIFVASLCRGKDPDRAPRFNQALEILSARGNMADLDDDPAQEPLADAKVSQTILELLPGRSYDLLLTHGPRGEYTRHRRHEEVARAVRSLWERGELRSAQLWQFAYEDGAGTYPPRPRQDATWQFPLSDSLWTRKRNLITRIYGFGEHSWEARAVTRVEAFDAHTCQPAIPKS